MRFFIEIKIGLAVARLRRKVSAGKIFGKQCFFKRVFGRFVALFYQNETLVNQMQNNFPGSGGSLPNTVLLCAGIGTPDSQIVHNQTFK